MELTLLPLLVFGTTVHAQDEAAMAARSLVSMGDVTRLQHVLAKARRGEEVVVAVIGGSITGGAMASTEENRWGNLVAKWWRDTFPQATIKFVNAGIGATGSNLGAGRASLELLPHHPDLVVAEFGVNDGNTEESAETLEGLTRQVLKQPNQPAMMLLFTMAQGGTNAQEWHGKVGGHYGLPMVSFRDALWPEIEAGRMRWEDVEADMVHPNDRGHAYCAAFVNLVLAEVLAKLPADADLAPIPPVPPPLISDAYEFTSFGNAERLQPTTNQGWSIVEMWPFGKTWEATEVGSVLEFDVTGTTVAVAFWRIKGDMGWVQAQVDDTEPVMLEGWFDQDWGGYSNYQVIARNLAPGQHRLRLELLEGKAPESTGHRFDLQVVMTAGRGGGQ